MTSTNNCVHVRMSSFRDYCTNTKKKTVNVKEHVRNLNLSDNICEEFWVNEEGKLKKKEILENHFNSQMTELSGRIKQTQIEQSQMQSERLRLEHTLDDKIRELEERFASERELLTNRIVEGDAHQWQLQEEKETLELRLNEEKAQLTTQMEVQVKELNSKILESYQKELELKMKNQELQAMLEKERIMYEKRLVEEKNMLEDCRNRSEALLKGSIKELEQRYNEDIAKLQNDLDSGSLEQEKMLKTMELLEQKYLDEKKKSEQQLLMEKKSYEEKFQALQNLVIEKEKVVEVTNQKLKEEEDKLKNEANISCIKAKQDLINNFEDVIESELQCSICNELFVNAVTLHCMHTFCEYCISKWKEKKKDCPVCRSKIVSETRMLILDSLIDRMLNKLSDDLKHRRQEVVEERKVKELLSAKPKPSSSESRSNPRERRNASSRGTNSRVEVVEPIVLSSESDDEDTLDSDASSVEGDPNVYYGGYGHCYRCVKLWGGLNISNLAKISSSQDPKVGEAENGPINTDVEHLDNTGSWQRKKDAPNKTLAGPLNVLSSKYESLDYDICENHLLLDEERSRGYKYVVKKNLARWFIFLLIGVITAIVACGIDITIEEFSKIKYKTLKYCILTILPVAAGSGIPQVKCYLNGVKIPRVVRIKTLAVKVIGVVTSVVGGLAAGKEGPMIHSGAVIAAGISQGKSTSMKRDLRIFKYFREDHEKRDFVSGGAAAGVAAAFGAPVGGVLFSLEEGASFWNQSLTWRIFFASVVSTFTLNVILSTYHGHPGELTYAGLLNFGKYIQRKWLKVLEAALVAAIAAIFGFIMMVSINDCKPLGKDPTLFPIQMHCSDGDYSAVAAIWFQTPESSVKSLFHDPPGSHKFISLGIFFLLYFLLSVCTYGLSVSGGLFIPAILTGAAWGRLAGMSLTTMLPNSTWVDPGKYALVGAAAQLGGTVRMTISLTVILIEATGNITFAFPLMLSLIMAKWTGDIFNEGIYDIHIKLSQVPILQWEPPPLSNKIYASEVMNHPVVVLKTVENVGIIVDILKATPHNGFPVVDPCTERKYGYVMRMEKKVAKEVNGEEVCRTETTREEQITESLQKVNITEEERAYTIDMRPFMNQSPYTVQHSASLPRVFRLFRALGLRHLTVVNDSHEVVGIVTRKDLARFHVWRHAGRMGVEQLVISDDS
uniref:Chloride channel protein n=1 Tax=Timema cristinae TaxID=61476 RepID=A0A7R9GX53_TIMCR|nr:unnamed protein product [Timema cristinae]